MLFNHLVKLISSKLVDELVMLIILINWSSHLQDILNNLTSIKCSYLKDLWFYLTSRISHLLLFLYNFHAFGLFYTYVVII